jgi:hypothetical protein
MEEALRWLHATPLGALADGNPWIVTACLFVHFVGLCLLVGAMLVVDLRILGFFRQVSLAQVFRLLPVAIFGFGLNAISGFILFAARPVNYWENPAFQAKLWLLAISGLNALLFTLFEQRVLAAAPDGQATPVLAKTSAAASLLLWFAIIFFGRLIAFQVAA